MSTTFIKLFGSITASTIWCQSSNIRIVWITMMAMTDRHGRVHASVPGLANIARVPVDDVRMAIRIFLSPDPDSRTPDHDGRRIEEIEGGWRLLNHSKYRDLQDEESKRESKRQWATRHRAEQKAAKLAAEAKRPITIIAESMTVKQPNDNF